MPRCRLRWAAHLAVHHGAVMEQLVQAHLQRGLETNLVVDDLRTPVPLSQPVPDIQGALQWQQSWLSVYRVRIAQNNRGAFR